MLPGAGAYSQEPQAIPNTLPLNANDFFYLAQEVGGGLTESGDGFGTTLAAGDFNNDGYDDLAIGAPGEAPASDPASGVVFLFEGSAGGPTLGSYSFLTQNDGGGNNEVGDRFGAALAVGDFNNDGYDDLAVGAPGEAPGSDPQSGAVFIFFGSSNGLTNGTFITQEDATGQNEAGDEFGVALAAGNFLGSAHDDLAIGTPGEAPASDPQSGVVFIFRGSANGLIGDTFITQEDENVGINEAGDEFGAALAAGNFLDSAYDDLAVGAPGEAPASDPQSGTVFIFRGAVNGPIGAFSLTQSDAGGVNEAGDLFGSALTAGNFFGDDFDDLAIGTPGEAPASDPQSGVVFLFTGSAGGLTNGTFITQGDAARGSNEANDEFGAALAAGNLDGGAYDELIVGVSGEAPGGSPPGGAVFAFVGGPGGITGGDYFQQEDVGGASEAGDRFGAALAVGNFNGSGAADLAVGAPEEAPPSLPDGGVVFYVAGRTAQPVLTHGPLLGMVSHNTVKIWARADRTATLNVQVKPAGDPWPGLTLDLPLSPGDDFTNVATFTNLAAESDYEYRVGLNNDFGGAVDSFTTASIPAIPDQFRFAIGADTRFASRPFAIFPSILANDPDFMILMGDQIYADSPVVIPDTLDAYRRQYKANWAEPNLANFVQNVSTYMIWDDHEILNDWDNGKTGRYANAEAAYDEYQGSHNPVPRVAGENYYAFSQGQADFYVLDTRTFRSASNAPDDANKTMLGAAQKADLKTWLSEANGRFKFLVSSVPWHDFSTTGNDSWQGYKTERNEIYTHIRDNCISGVVLLSGDQHWAGVVLTAIAPDYNLYEVSPTPLGIANRPEPASNDPAILFKYDDARVYGLFEVNTEVIPAQLTIDVFREDNAGLYHLELTEAEISPACIEYPIYLPSISK